VISGLEGLLEIVSLEMTRKSFGAGTHSKRWREREFQILGAATLKLQTPQEVQTNGTESRLVFDNVREQVE